jgi:hypothetical protein
MDPTRRGRTQRRSNARHLRPHTQRTHSKAIQRSTPHAEDALQRRSNARPHTQRTHSKAIQRSTPHAEDALKGDPTLATSVAEMPNSGGTSSLRTLLPHNPTASAGWDTSWDGWMRGGCSCAGWGAGVRRLIHPNRVSGGGPSGLTRDSGGPPTRRSCVCLDSIHSSPAFPTTSSVLVSQALQRCSNTRETRKRSPFQTVDAFRTC